MADIWLPPINAPNVLNGTPFPDRIAGYGGDDILNRVQFETRSANLPKPPGG
jgi:hypothetical protein